MPVCSVCPTEAEASELQRIKFNIKPAEAYKYKRAEAGSRLGGIGGKHENRRVVC